MDQTRQRITEAAVRLHTTVGPAATTISGIADEAGVTRVTVYRHFRDEEELFAACTQHWAQLHPQPDIEAWRAIPEVDRRVHRALRQLYGWYSDNRDDLLPLKRDVDAIPASVQEAVRARDDAMADVLVEGWRLRGAARRRARAAAGHVVSFWTWRSLVVGQGLSSAQAAQLAAAFLLAAPQPD